MAPKALCRRSCSCANAATPGRLLKLPDGLDPEIAALHEPMGVALHAVNRSGAGPDSRVVVLGAGPIGLGAIIWLKHRGWGTSSPSICPPSDWRSPRTSAPTRPFGPAPASSASSSPRSTARAVRGAPATDVFIDAAGAPAALTEVVRVARFGAQITVVAVYKAPVPLDLSAMLHKEMTLITSVAYPTELSEVVAFLGANADRMRAYISDVYDLSEFDQAVARARDSSAGKVMVRVRR